MTTQHATGLTLGRLFHTALFCIILLLGGPGLLNAQTGAESEEYDGVMEEVMVTAQRREQRLQDVPISMSAFDAKAIERNRLIDVADYIDRSANVSFNAAGGQRQRRNVSIRGIRRLAGNQGATTIGVFVDEFNIAASTVNPPILDVERIEILRGPQPTFYGRGTVGGAINFITNKPGPEIYGSAALELSRYDTKVGEGIINLPVAETFFVRAALRYEDSDGFITNVNESGGTSSHQWWFGRIAARWLLSDRFTADFVYTRSDETQDLSEELPTGLCSGSTAYGAPCPDLLGTGAYPENRNLRNINIPDRNTDDIDIFTLKLNYEGEAVSVTSITGYINRFNVGIRDFDFSRQDLFVGFQDYDYEDFSQEIRLQSAGDNRLDWAVGVVYSKFSLVINQDVFGGEDYFGGLFAGLNLSDYLEQEDSETKAAYAEVIWHANEKLDITVGGRYTKESNEEQIDFISFFQPQPQALGVTKTSDFAPRLAATYAFSNALTGYATISKGFKSGGLQANAAFNPEFDKETLWNYEIGLKGTAADGRLRYAVALFYMDWQDLQVSARTDILNEDGTISFNFGTANAAAASSPGGELELNFLATDNLELSLVVGYNGAKFDDYPNAVVTTAASPTRVLDLSGDKIPGGSDWNGSASAQYNFLWGADRNNSGFVRAEFIYRAGYEWNTSGPYTDIAYYDPTPSRDYFNLRAGITAGRHQLSVFVDNVLNQDWYVNRLSTTSVSGSQVTPQDRRYGIRYKVQFGPGF